jgi:hypothetical protein
MCTGVGGGGGVMETEGHVVKHVSVVNPYPANVENIVSS